MEGDEEAPFSDARYHKPRGFWYNFGRYSVLAFETWALCTVVILLTTYRWVAMRFESCTR